MQIDTLCLYPKSQDLLSLLYTSGENIDLSNTPEEIKPKNFVSMTKFQMNLMDICRKAIRKHLLHLDPHSHLFGRVPQLGLPPSLEKYLMFGFPPIHTRQDGRNKTNVGEKSSRQEQEEAIVEPDGKN